MKQEQSSVKISHILSPNGRKKVARPFLAALLMFIVGAGLFGFNYLILAWIASSAANALLLWTFVQFTEVATAELKPKVLVNK